MKWMILLLTVVTSALTVYGQDDSADVDSAAYAAEMDSINLLPDTTAFATANLYADTAMQGSMQEHLEAYQREKVSSGKFDEKKWKDIVKSADFSEKDEKPVTAEPPAKRTSFKFDGPMVKLLSYILIAGLIIFILYYILRNVNLTTVKVDKTVNLVDPGAPVQNIDELPIDDLLKEAVNSGNYRLAIRLHYLDILRRLNTTGKIVWMKDKTNREYLAELFAISWYFAEFRRVTLAYEQVWYGEHALTADAYHRLQLNFEEIKKQIVDR